MERERSEKWEGRGEEVKGREGEGRRGEGEGRGGGGRGEEAIQVQTRRDERIGIEEER